ALVFEEAISTRLFRNTWEYGYCGSLALGLARLVGVVFAGLDRDLVLQNRGFAVVGRRVAALPGREHGRELVGIGGIPLACPAPGLGALGVVRNPNGWTSEFAPLGAWIRGLYSRGPEEGEAGTEPVPPPAEREEVKDPVAVAG